MDQDILILCCGPFFGYIGFVLWANAPKVGERVLGALISGPGLSLAMIGFYGIADFVFEMPDVPGSGGTFLEWLDYGWLLGIRIFVPATVVTLIVYFVLSSMVARTPVAERVFGKLGCIPLALVFIGPIVISVLYGGIGYFTHSNHEFLWMNIGAAGIWSLVIWIIGVPIALREP